MERINLNSYYNCDTCGTLLTHTRRSVIIEIEPGPCASGDFVSISRNRSGAVEHGLVGPFVRVVVAVVVPSLHRMFACSGVHICGRTVAGIRSIHQQSREKNVITGRPFASSLSEGKLTTLWYFKMSSADL